MRMVIWMVEASCIKELITKIEGNSGRGRPGRQNEVVEPDLKILRPMKEMIVDQGMWHTLYFGRPAHHRRIDILSQSALYKELVTCKKNAGHSMEWLVLERASNCRSLTNTDYGAWCNPWSSHFLSNCPIPTSMENGQLMMRWEGVL